MVFWQLLCSAEVEEAIEHPSDDVKGLLWLPIDYLQHVEQLSSLENALSEGAILLEEEPLPRTTSLGMLPDESMRVVTALLNSISHVCTKKQDIDICGF